MGADDFVLNVPLNQALFGFGDAVCVPVVEWIANNYLTPVWKVEFAEETVPIRPEKPVSYRARSTR